VKPIDTSGLLAMRTAILDQNKALQRAAGAGKPGAPEGLGTGEGGFGNALQSALAHVNELQANSSAIATSYEKGETTDIAAVMLTRQKASIGFEATLQVRNKLLSAYKDIMSMPV
jgi:flagellar hook-basal body complex protein FliE